ncbi:hypothetical protein GUITHDRAFT_151568, partial [Guillardia theta CCMP2712]
MFSWGEIFVIFGASAMLFGKKDLPIMCRRLGSLVGRGVVSMRRIKDEYTKKGPLSEFSELHHEMRTTLFEINSVHSEIRSNVQIIPPMYGSMPFSPAKQQNTGNTVAAYQSIQNAYRPPYAPPAQSNATAEKTSIPQTPPANAPHVPTHVNQTTSEAAPAETSGDSVSSSQILFGAPSSHEAASFESVTNKMPGGADHIL